ncbi:hypothetical protein DERP_005116 [Dermatophagoides pteronyssinus]|uniref:Uncharacterized protein n=1 Tax=Dermatophagoides pteronyssinus TaxID=6956 RepID=A0ABQ8JTK1_DERPT|nr:hypothetical protein DERP_005116 [Dermatophagoides pteronyssinus]
MYINIQYNCSDEIYENDMINMNIDVQRLTTTTTKLFSYIISVKVIIFIHYSSQGILKDNEI